MLKEKEIKKEKNVEEQKKSTYNKVMNVILWILLILWISVCVTDYLRTNNEKEPLFCLKEETKKYEDGTVYICTGAGYRFFNYKRDSYNALQFGGIWVKEHNPLKE